LLLISTSHRGLLDWFSRTVCGDTPEPQPQAKPKLNGAARSARKANGHRKPRNDAGDRYLTRRRAASVFRRIAASKFESSSTIGDLAIAVGKSRTSIVSALHRLRAAGLAESIEGRWKLSEEPAPRSLPEKWTAPLSATCERTRVHA
jgi:DNA-binding transcriptional ArsR family regulator